MTPDWLLLRRYTREHSQEAFATLTARYLNMVYAVCLREVPDPALAQDAAQAVFLVLARTAPSFRSRTALPGWLFRTARFTAQNARTREERRRRYEKAAAQEYAAMETPTGAEVWAEIEPLLNQSLAALRETDRACLLLRFFQEQSFAEVGASLGLSEEAARKRVTRALDKLRQFFVKEGVAIPAAALAVLLTAHAAKAAPPPLAANLAVLIPGLAAGHLSAAFTGSHAYQLSEGAPKAMKLVQLKVAVSIAAVLTIGLTTYAVARNTVPHTAGPGHVLRQAPGQRLTGPEVAKRCRAAYAALRTYQVTSTVTVQSVEGISGKIEDEHASAVIQFIRPGKIHAEGLNTGAKPFAYVSDGFATVETDTPKQGPWKKATGLNNANGAEMAIARVTGIATNAATTVPALLLDTEPGSTYGGWGIPMELGKGFTSAGGDPTNPFTKLVHLEIKEDTLQGHPCYALAARSQMLSGSESLWIDKQTFLLRRLVSDTDTAAQTFTVGGIAHAVPAMKVHEEQNFSNECVNEMISGSTFALPPAP